MGTVGNHRNLTAVGRSCLTLAAAMLPSPAAAAPLASLPVPVLVTVGAATVVCLLLAVALWRCRREVTALVRRSKVLEADIAAERSVLDTAPGAYIRWQDGLPDGAAAVGLADLLALPDGETADFAALTAVFGGEDAARLRERVEALWQDGTGFTLELESEDGDRAFDIAGARAGLAGIRLADMLWVRDVSDALRRRNALTVEATESTDARSKLIAMVDALPIPVWKRGADLAIQHCNRAYVAAVEADSVEQVLAEEREIGAGAIAGRGRALAETAKSGGTPAAGRHHIVIAGARRYMAITEVPLGDTGELLGFAVDLTDVEEAQTELNRHIEAHGEVLEKLSTAIAIYGPDMRLKFFNTAYVSLWGLAETWLSTEPTISDVLEAQREHRRLPEYADFPAFKKERQKLFTSLIEPLEDLQHLPDGTTLRMVITPHPFGGLLFTFEDVTDKLVMERSYNTLIAVQRESLDNLYEGVAVFGSDGRLKLNNPTYASMWQLPQDVLDSQPHVAELLDYCKEFFEDRNDWPALKEKIIARVAERDARPMRLQRADGSVLDIGCVPLPDGGLLFSYLDVTDSFQVERALRERNEALEAADQLKSEFIANVSYELRTPLNTIIGFAEILANQYFGELNPRQMEYSSGILDSSQRLLGLINDILDLAMIEAGRMTLEVDNIDVHAMLASVLNLTREWARKQGLKVEFTCPADIGEMTGDERRLKQTVLNLVTNAINFTPPGGTVTIGAERKAAAVVITVADTGVGIEQGDQNRVFERFERGAGGQARQAGVGLGLSLVKSFVELHGGQVRIESEPETGTKISCYLPVEAEAQDERRVATGSG